MDRLAPPHPQHRFLPSAHAAAAPPAPGVLDLSRLDAAVTPCRAVVEAARAADPLRRPDPRGSRLRRRLADRLEVDPDALVLGAGVPELLAALAATLVGPGHRVAVALPGADGLERAVLVPGAAYVDIGRDFHLRPRLDALSRLIDDHAVRLVVVADPDPLSGAPLDQPPPEDGPVWWLQDRSAALAQPDVAGALGLPPERTIVLGSLSTPAGIPGLPVAWAHMPPDLADRVWRVRPAIPWSHVAEAACLAWLDAPAEAEDELQAARDRRDALTEGLSELDGLSVFDSAGAAVAARRPGVEGTALAVALDKRGFRVAASASHAWHDAIRVTAPPEPRLKALVDAVRDALASLAPLLVAAIAGLAALPGCRDTPAEPGATEHAGPIAPVEPATSSPPAPSLRPEPSPDGGPPPGAAKPDKGPPVVGGCGRGCANAEDAFEGFVAGLASADRQTRVPLVLDTSVLVVDGERVGERLAGMWLRGERSPRLQAIAALVDDLYTSAGEPDEGALLQAANDARLEERPRRAEATIALPNGKTWTVELHRRGLEWLVRAIRR